jgi:hemoglobin
MTVSSSLLLPPSSANIDEALIREVVFGFYGRVREDDVLGPIFSARIAEDAWPAHLERMCDFWSSVLLRTARYGGQPLRPHLGIDEISDSTFERWLGLFGQTVEAVCDPVSAEAFLQMAERIARSFRMAIAFHRGETPGDWPKLRRDAAAPRGEVLRERERRRTGGYPRAGGGPARIDPASDLQSPRTRRDDPVDIPD